MGAGKSPCDRFGRGVRETEIGQRSTGEIRAGDELIAEDLRFCKSGLKAKFQNDDGRIMHTGI
jgi:hypothetical protein